MTQEKDYIDTLLATLKLSGYEVFNNNIENENYFDFTIAKEEKIKISIWIWTQPNKTFKIYMSNIKKTKQFNTIEETINHMLKNITEERKI